MAPCRWSIDGLPTYREDVILRNRGISTSEVIPVDQATRSFRANITILRTIINVHTNITCLAEIMFSSVASNSVLFQIQGYLDPPPNLIITNSSKQYLMILRWDKPFSLDITDVTPDISHYNVCYTLFTAKEPQCTCVNETELIFLNASVPLLFTVSAVNIVGEGNASSVVHNSTNCGNSKGLTTILV